MDFLRALRYPAPERAIDELSGVPSPSHLPFNVSGSTRKEGPYTKDMQLSLTDYLQC